MSHLSNPLITADQLAARIHHTLPIQSQDVVVFHTARQTQAAGILLRLPQSVSARAVVLLQRYLASVEPSRYQQFEFNDLSAGTLYLAAKVSAHPRSTRSIANVYAFLGSPAATQTLSKPDPALYYLSESEYVTQRNLILRVEGQVLYVLSFNTHVALPHAIAITYLQSLDLFSAGHAGGYAQGTGSRIAKTVVKHLNTALLSPQLLYLTHQPNALAVAAIYLAARDEDIKLPEGEWWCVFDVDREELGFLAVGMRSVTAWATEIFLEREGSMLK